MGSNAGERADCRVCGASREYNGDEIRSRILARKAVATPSTEPIKPAAHKMTRARPIAKRRVVPTKREPGESREAWEGRFSERSLGLLSRERGKTKHRAKPFLPFALVLRTRDPSACW